ncbi:trehalose-phosphatase [Streptomyces sp. WMMC500]|uniref:trehalose-phosphatase n=1 Tax=Streptomyces sp. WMMC500 TaxID=3015154 RepID=UPI00248AE25E|nr:trehalose-phosphatase [Streptomyces sp. WMMC500]WBB64038.1 trehalose-phosphatase [Streptomyces sp. WMMC500]
MGSTSAARLPVPATEAGRAGLAALLADPEQALVAFDFDGTLAPIVPDPDAARAHPGAVPALARLAPRVGTVAVITGRPAAVAVRYGGFAGVAGLAHLRVLGHYGDEQWDAATGTLRTPAPHPGVAAVQAELPGVLETADAWRGTWIEDKGRAVAVHTRRAADPAKAADALRKPLDDLAAAHGLVVEPGRFVLELRPPGMDKGRALTTLTRETGARTVLYAGDDLGDLAAYDAVEALRPEGVTGLLVCSAAMSGEGADALADRADLTVDGPQGVVDLLTALAEALGA